MGELHRFLPACLIEGLGSSEVKVNHHARTLGSSKYASNRTFRVLDGPADGLFMKRFLTRPMQSLVSASGLPGGWAGKSAWFYGRKS